MRGTSYLELKKYFNQIVEKSEFLEDFIGYFSRELRNKEQSSRGIQFPCQALFNYNFGIEGDGDFISGAKSEFRYSSGRSSR